MTKKINPDLKVSGAIIGGDYRVGQLYYENRKQGPQLYADQIEDLLEKANAYVGKLKTEPGAEHIFPDQSAWRLEILQ